MLLIGRPDARNRRRTAATGDLPDEEHDLGAAGRVPDGLRGLLSRGAPGPQGLARGILDRRASGDGGGVSPLREGDRPRHVGGAGARSRGVPGRRRRSARPRVARLPADARTGRSRGFPQLVGLGAGGAMAPPRGPGDDRSRPRTAPGHAHRVGGRGRVRRLGRQGASERGAMGVRRARRARVRRLCLGRRSQPERPDDGEHLAGRVPLAEPRPRRVRTGPHRSAASRPTASGSTT